METCVLKILKNWSGHVLAIGLIFQVLSIVHHCG